MTTLDQVFGRKQPVPRKGRLTPAKTTHDSLIAGVELEIENLNAGQDRYMSIAGAAWDVVADGSLRPRDASWEFISKPMHLGTLVSELELLFKNLPLGEENYSDRCSVHVHTNVADFTQEQLSNLVLVYPIFEAVLFEFINHYNTEENKSRDTNLYCIPWKSCLNNRNLVEIILKNPNGVRVWEKYTALNLAPVRSQCSVEWRHMHGTNDMDKITKWLNIIGAITLFCKENNFEDIVKTIKTLNDVSAYQQFFEAVLQNTLPYKEDSYRVAMAEGVVHAKWSMINLGKKPTPTLTAGLDVVEIDHARLEELAARVGIVAARRQFVGDPAAARWVWGEEREMRPAIDEHAQINRDQPAPINGAGDHLAAAGRVLRQVQHEELQRGQFGFGARLRNGNNNQR